MIFRPLQIYCYYQLLLSQFIILLCLPTMRIFFKHKDIKVLFATVNKELKSINKWFISNRLSLYVGKTKLSLFHKPRMTNDLPLKQPK